MIDDAPNQTPGWLGHLQRRYFQAVVVLSSTAVLLLVVIMAVQVFFRYVLNDSLIWAEEVCRYILIWLTFLFAGAALQHGEMVSLELLVQRFPGASRLIFIVPSYLVGLAFLAALVWYGWKFASINSFQTVPAADFIWSDIVGEEREANLSIFWIYVAVPVGMALMFVHLAISLVFQISDALHGRPFASRASLEADSPYPPEGWGD